MAKFTYISKQATLRPDENIVLQAAQAVENLVEWEHCDCGCPQQRSPKSRKDVELLRIAAFIRVNLLPS